MAESYKPTAAMQAAARRGLKLREKYNRGLSAGQAKEEGVGSGVARARDIINGNLSLATVKRMNSFFARHEKNYNPDKKEADGGPTAGTIAWLLWGGSSGKSWSKKIVNSQEIKKSIKTIKALDDDELTTVADAIEAYANESIDESEDTFGKFMYFAELIRNGHRDIVEADIDLISEAYQTKLFEIVSAYEQQEITKSIDAENHYVTFVCMIPDEVDAHGDVVDADEIRKAMISFNKSTTKSANLFHMFKTDSFEIVESYTLPVEITMQNVEGEVQYLPKGTWLTTLEVNDDAVWQKILDGEYAGVSIGGRGRAETIEQEVN